MAGVVDALRPHLSETASSAIAATFGDPPDFTVIADLIITHEATHLFHEIDTITWNSEFPADWVMELFANLGMQGYLATHESDQLRLLHAMAEATLDAGDGIWGLQDLARMGESMQTSVTNCVWYEFRMIRFAEQLWTPAVKTDSGTTTGCSAFQSCPSIKSWTGCLGLSLRWPMRYTGGRLHDQEAF